MSTLPPAPVAFSRPTSSTEWPPWRQRLHEVLFEADTLSGLAFSIALIVCIVGSVLVVMLDSVQNIRAGYGSWLSVAEWAFTVFFTVEIVLRLISVRRPLGYVVSFFGVVDILAVLPSYLGLFFPGTQYLSVIRVLRVLRVFRILKLVQYLGEADFILSALQASRRKISVFLFGIMNLVIILGALMHLVEGEENGFTSIPKSIYWAVVTLCTVGYGDISPKTPLGQFISVVVMIIGYGVLAVPTGIVTARLIEDNRKAVSTQVCPDCSGEGHDPDAVHCKFCGARL